MGALLVVLLGEELHADDGEHEEADDEHEHEVSQVADRAPDDADQRVQRRPRARKLEHADLRAHTLTTRSIISLFFCHWQ